jgi:hypothetical protein
MAKTSTMNKLLYDISTAVQSVIDEDARQNLAFLRKADEALEKERQLRVNTEQAFIELEEKSRAVVENMKDAESLEKALLSLAEFLGPRE